MENELVVKTRGKKVVIMGLYKITYVKILKTVKALYNSKNLSFNYKISPNAVCDWLLCF